MKTYDFFLGLSSSIWSKHGEKFFAGVIILWKSCNVYFAACGKQTVTEVMLQKTTTCPRALRVRARVGTYEITDLDEPFQRNWKVSPEMSQMTKIKCFHSTVLRPTQNSCFYINSVFSGYSNTSPSSAT